MNKDIAIWGTVTSVSLVLLLLILKAEGFFEPDDESIERVFPLVQTNYIPLRKNA